MKLHLPLRLLAAVSLATASFFAQAADVTVAYQTTVDPAKVAQADGTYEKVTQAKIDWRKFDNGADIIAAIASGDVQIGYLGSSPLTAAITRKVPVETFLIATQIGAAEALVARDGSGIKTPQDLVGKKVAVPFVSTGHYSLLAALKHWKIDPAKVQILNLAPPAIIAAWKRGDIDATYVWDPALGVAKENGKVLITSGELAQFGAPTFDAWIVRKDFAEKHPQIVTAFAKVTLDAYADYRKDPKAWLAEQSNVDKLVKLSGAKASDIPLLLQGNVYPLAADQVISLGAPTTKAITDTAVFLKEQGKVEAVLPDYAPYVSAKYITN
ncbi:Taurine-binding periplasmic protein TauA [Pseudomonas chlororaphis subsp. aurantiaca]|uniref:Taurine ABC transporter substrate-binding protein n=1 Tax=Pseudomonas chlororaphis TaxID=587753 RepID=A0AAQ1FRF0_9PSED|nr:MULTISPECIES: taurine ABC transporter substrate-binding protein [Pseudomonas]AUG38579.1 taurine ABC transporter substrate-binding protein [Pseudomonas chlororaphis]AZD33068.1 Taurine-binding periplasmic protein TauA [Pseudomonas chlororaphis subsp. aurantiaca]AZD39398.1 Taurine-binding periplasmic protein TauA [Pseudomonas chlororaphis subsp. aurantiaca]AZD45737.1 Taurine-binding periplasmic protein TauA [Pseudomonas chlororaphis subsp. aurantiaca]AZD64217.1 Taurine-binding periplasmic prot